MKKLIVKVKNKRLKGNISLLVILILLASSVISLLSINQIQRLLTYWNMTFNYFRAFYLAKAWTELWLTEVYNSGDWLNHRIESWSTIVLWNLLSEYSGFNPYFDMTISWSFLYLTEDIRKSDECSSWNKIKLATWAWIMLSLFSDDNTNLSQILSDSVGNKKLENIKDLSFDWWSINSELTFAFFTYEYDSEIEDFVMDDIVVKTWKNINSFINSLPTEWINSDNKKYLTIKNSWNEDVEFCIKMGDKLIPYSNSLITVFWHYGDMEVGLQSVVKKWVPDWTLNVIGNQTPS